MATTAVDLGAGAPVRAAEACTTAGGIGSSSVNGKAVPVGQLLHALAERALIALAIQAAEPHLAHALAVRC